jgi:acyl carrier protein
MNREEMRSILLRLVEEEMGETYPSLDDGVALKDGLNLDSVDVVGLVMRVERELQVRLSTSELEQIRTVGDMLDLLLAKQAASSSANKTTGTE